MITEKELYDLPFGEEKLVGTSYAVTRVIGGWLYRYRHGINGLGGVTFVPDPKIKQLIEQHRPSRDYLGPR